MIVKILITVLLSAFSYAANAETFAQFLKNLPLSKSTYIKTYTGQKLYNNSRAVLCDFGTKENEQCADALIYLRSKYLWQNRQYNKIVFHFVNSFKCDYVHWANGYRVDKSNRHWVRAAKRDYSYTTFRKYLSYVFQYANTWSLCCHDLVNIDKFDVGMVIIVPGFPGHCVIVTDIKQQNGRYYVKIAEGYTPAQQIEVFNRWFVFNTKQFNTPRFPFYNFKILKFK